MTPDSMRIQKYRIQFSQRHKSATLKILYYIIYNIYNIIFSLHFFSGWLLPCSIKNCISVFCIQSSQKGWVKRKRAISKDSPVLVPFIVLYDSRNSQEHFYWVQRYDVLSKLPNIFHTFYIISSWKPELSRIIFFTISLGILSNRSLTSCCMSCSLFFDTRPNKYLNTR